MAHGEGWQYLQAGRFLERAEATAALLDLHFGDHARFSDASTRSEHAEWVGLLRSCSSLEAYCRHYTADLRPERIAEFLLLNSGVPAVHPIRGGAVSSRRCAPLASCPAGGAAAAPTGWRGACTRSLDYGQVDEILNDDPHAYIEGIGRHCSQIHGAIYQTYIAYPIETALPA